MGLLDLVRQLLAHARTPSGRAVVIYLLVAPPASVVSAVVGSLSEYRFPHPLLTTTLHLSISLVALVALSLFAGALLPLLQPSRRLLSTPKARSSSTTSSTSLTRLLSSLASHAPSRRSLLTPLTPYSLSATLLAMLAALVDLRAARITEAPFWQLARLLPLPLVVSVSDGGPRVAAMVVWGVMMAGPSVGVGASLEGWACGAAWAVGVAGWVLSARRGITVGGKEDEGVCTSPTILLHLALSTILLLPPLLLSGEMGAASSSGHLGFFTEIGFWLQETVMALAGLASLGAFWGLLKHLDASTIFLVVALKDFLVPQLFFVLFGNPLPEPRITGSKLALWRQWFALALVGAVQLASQEGAPSGTARAKGR